MNNTMEEDTVGLMNGVATEEDEDDIIRESDEEEDDDFTRLRDPFFLVYILVISRAQT